MASLWTDDDHSGHPWIAGRPPPRDAAASNPAPIGAHDGSAPKRFARPAAMAAACVAAALAGALIEVLR
jgi:hypothetical protein